MYLQSISPPIDLRHYLTGFCYNATCYLFSRPMFPLSTALRKVATELSSGSAAFSLLPMLRALSPHELEALSELAGASFSSAGFPFGGQFDAVERVAELIDRGCLVVYAVPEAYYYRLNDYRDIFYKSVGFGDLSDKDPIQHSTDTLWQCLGGDVSAPPETDFSLPPLKFPELQKLGTVEVDLSEQAIHTRSDIVAAKLGLHAVKDNDELNAELERLGCSAHLARTALDRGLNRWQSLSQYKYGRQLLHFFWLQTDERAQHLLLKHITDEPHFVFRLPAEVFLALGAVGFKNLRGITDPRVRVGPFNIKAIEAMAALADQLANQAAVAAMEAEALRDDTGPQSRSASIWADLPTNYYIQLKVKTQAGKPVENQRWWVQTPDGRVHSGRTNLHGIARVSGLNKLGPCQIKFPGVLVARAGVGAGPGKEGAVFTEQVNGEYEFIATATHWVTAILRDTDGKAVANEAWWIKTPDGEVHTGVTDDSGAALVKHSLKPGRCGIRFPKAAVLKDGCIAPPKQTETAGTYVVQQGDTLVRIAKANGLNDADDIYLHPDNAAFREMRPNPDVIFPGDEFTLPAPNNNPFDAAMDVEHEFVLSRPSEVVRFKLLDPDGKPYTGKRVVLQVGGQQIEQYLQDDGQVEIEMTGLSETSGALALYLSDAPGAEPIKYDIALAHIDPVDTLSGVQARCNSLGFDCGVVDGVMGQKTREGVSAFQQHYGLTVDGDPGPETEQKLQEIYGC